MKTFKQELKKNLTAVIWALVLLLSVFVIVLLPTLISIILEMKFSVSIILIQCLWLIPSVTFLLTAENHIKKD